MSLLKLQRQIDAVADKGDKTARELEIVKKRQREIEARLIALKLEVDVQQRNFD